MGHLFPVYYTAEALTQEEMNTAQKSWKLILEDKTPPYILITQGENAETFGHKSCRDWFGHAFYERLFDGK